MESYRVSRRRPVRSAKTVKSSRRRPVRSAKTVRSSRRPTTIRLKRRVTFGVSPKTGRYTLKAGSTRWQVEHQSRGIGPLRRSKLSQYGYSTKIAKKARTRALNKAVKNYGALSIYRSLNALAVYNKNTNPEMAAVAKEDRDMIRSRFFRE